MFAITTSAAARSASPCTVARSSRVGWGVTECSVTTAGSRRASSMGSR